MARIPAFVTTWRFVRPLSNDSPRCVAFLVIVAVARTVFSVAPAHVSRTIERFPDFRSGVAGATSAVCAAPATIGLSIFGEATLRRFSQIHAAFRAGQIHTSFRVRSNHWIHTTSSGAKIGQVLQKTNGGGVAAELEGTKPRAMAHSCLMRFASRNQLRSNRLNSASTLVGCRARRSL